MSHRPAEGTRSYDDYCRETSIKCANIAAELGQLKHKKQKLHQSLMKEQARAKSSKAQGKKHIEQRKWPTIVSNAKANKAAETSGRKAKSLYNQKQQLLNQLSELYVPEIIRPTFALLPGVQKSHKLVIIKEGSVGYQNFIITEINFSATSGELIFIAGDNGSGKSTLIKAILDDPTIMKFGCWSVPKPEELGYFEQNYANLAQHKTVLTTIQDLVNDWTHEEIRKHLNDFLFRKNEEVYAEVATLSGGEKARLSLAQIAVKPPKLLILD